MAIIVIFILAVIALIPANVASDKGRNFGVWLIYGILLFPFAMIHSLLLGPTENASGKKKCPQCAEVINSEAKVCPNCGASIRVKTGNKKLY